MKSVLGFGREYEMGTAVQPETERNITNAPIKSLVQVRFPEINRTYAYYNDRFDLREGDLVFVTGKLAGTCGVVDSVNYKFKINLADYERVIAQPEVRLSGTYYPIIDKMVSYDADAVSPDTFRSWVKAPVADDDEDKPEFVMGEGYSFELDHFFEDEAVDQEVFHRAVNYCNEGLVQYRSGRDGVGTAFVEGTRWYEVNFKFENGYVSDMYCECPYPSLCKHNLAVLITLRELLKKAEKDEFTAISRGFFLRMLSISKQPITL